MIKRYSDRVILEVMRGSDKQKEEKILKYLYQKCFPMALYYIKKYNGGYQDAKDVFHEAMVGFYESVKQNRFRGDSSIDTYIYAIIKHTWITAVKKRRREGELPENVESHTDYVSKLDISSLNLGNQNRDDSLAATINYCIDKLGERCAEILKLYYYENYTMDEITEMIGFKNSNSAKTQKYKCLQKLISLVDNSPELKLKLETLR